MPSRSRSFMSRLRGRSRPAAKAKGRGRRSDGDRAGKEKRPNGGGAASEGGGGPTSTTTATASPRAVGGAASPEAGRRAPAGDGSKNGNPKPKPQKPAPQAAAAASNHGRAAHCSTETPPGRAPLPLGTPPTDTSRTTRASEDFSDGGPDQFVTAFARSPPSFDQFDSDILLSDTGVFPQPNAASNGHNTSGNGHGCGVWHSHSNSYPSDGEPQSLGPHGILWGDSSVVHDDGDESGSAQRSGVQDCFSGSADPPAILTDLNDDTHDDEGSQNGGPATANDQVWLESFASKEWKDDAPRDKGGGGRARLVSPSPPKPGANASGGGDDLAAWGGAGAAEFQKGQTGFPDAGEDVFGSNFFKSGGFDSGDDGFGAIGDAFGNSWMDVGNGTSDRRGGVTNQSDPWGGASFANAPFPSASLNYSGSNEGPGRGGAPPEEKKDDDVRISRGPARKDGNPPSTAPAQASRVWDGQANGAPAALAASSQAGRDAVPDPSRRHPLAAGPSSSRRETHEVVVTFDTSLTNNAGRPPSIISERKVSHGSLPAAPRGHRRLNSKESSSSHRSQRPRRNGRGGGSVGSNSSAVDQILEHYRQKRRMKDRVGGRVPGGASSVHSAQSVQSGSQFGSSVAGTSVTNGAAGHRRIPSGGSSSHHRHHRRNPSSESVSRIIDNLETAAAAAGRGKAPVVPRAPSPAVGKNYSSGNGQAGGDDAADHQFLLANIEATIGPRGVAPDMESLSGRSHRSQGRSGPRASSRHRSSSRPHRSPPRNGGRGDASVDSRASRNSFRTYQSTRSALTHMSRETQSVANDLFRLEAQLAEVARQQEEEGRGGAAADGVAARSPPARGGGGKPGGTLGADPVPRPRSPFQVTAPPGKLGILLSNRSGQRGPTHVSAVRSESVLAGRVHVGDVLASIDGEDVTRMNSKEITAIMARKVDFERVLRFRPLVSGSPQRQEWI